GEAGADGSLDRVIFLSTVQTAPRVMTAVDGRFVFRDLARGRYTLEATAAGYLTGQVGPSRPGGAVRAVDLTTDEKLRDVTIRLWRPAAVTGRVTDEAGDSAAGVQVKVLRRTSVSGELRWLTAGSALADDRGIYRLADLSPGEYVVGIP